MIKQLLWIDDEIRLFRAYIWRLEKGGEFKVVGVKTVTDALSLITKAGEWPFELTIIDINLKPGLRELMTESEAETAGLRLLEELKSHHRDAKLLILTGTYDRLDAISRKKVENIPRIDKANLSIDTLPEYLMKLGR